MRVDRLRSWWRPGEFSIPGIKVSLVVGVAAALILWWVGVGPLWLILILAPVVAFVLSWVAALAAGTLIGSKRILFHLAIAGEWEAARSSGGPYRRSTLGVSLEEQGFIHCAFPRQLQKVADAVFPGRDDVVLLAIDAGGLDAEVRVEAVEGGERFPHIYGPLNLDAVIDSMPVPLGPDGRLDVHALFRTKPGDFFQP